MNRAIVLFFYVAVAAHFDERSLVSFKIPNEDVLRSLHSGGVDILRDRYSVGSEVVALVDPKVLSKWKHSYTLLQKPQKELRTVADPRDTSFHASYHTKDEIDNKVIDLVNAAPPSLGATFTEIGRSFQNRTINAVTFGHSPDGNVIFISCGIHAREWISPATCVWSLEQLLSQTPTSTISAMLQKVKFAVVLQVNPDGYEYSRLSNRDQRKNMRGVDLNRNFGEHWDVNSDDISSEIYRGSAPFSELESAAVRDFFNGLKNSHRILAGIDMHSFGQIIYRPYGWSQTETPPNEARIVSLCDQMTAAAFAVHSNSYTHEKAARGGVGAAADDWYTANSYYKIGLTIELRPQIAYNFELDPAQIVPASEEGFAMILKFTEFFIGLWENEWMTTTTTATTTTIATLTSTTPRDTTTSAEFSKGSDATNSIGLTTTEFIPTYNEPENLESDSGAEDSTKKSFDPSAPVFKIAVGIAASIFIGIVVVGAVRFVRSSRERRFRFSYLGFGGGGDIAPRMPVITTYTLPSESSDDL